MILPLFYPFICLLFATVSSLVSHLCVCPLLYVMDSFLTYVGAMFIAYFFTYFFTCVSAFVVCFLSLFIDVSTIMKSGSSYWTDSKLWGWLTFVLKFDFLFLMLFFNVSISSQCFCIQGMQSFRLYFIFVKLCCIWKMCHVFVLTCILIC